MNTTDNDVVLKKCKESYIHSICKKLYRKLSTEQKAKFAPSVDIHERLQFTETLLTEYKLLPINPTKIPKINQRSLKYRIESDEYIEKRNLHKALESINKCIAFAKNSSEFLSMGYAKRSQILFDLRLYKECLYDIDLATTTANCPISCQEQLESRKNLCNMIITRKSKRTNELRYNENFLGNLSYDKHPKVPYIANCLKLTELPVYGRSIITNRYLQPGDVIAIEKPFASTVFKSFMYRCCTNCLKERYCLIPCPKCTSAMFCDKKCLEAAAKFHIYECEIINYMTEVMSDHELLSIRIPLQSILFFNGDIDKLINFEQIAEEDRNISVVDSDDSLSTSDDEDDGYVWYDFQKQCYLTILDKNYYPMHAISSNVTECNANLSNKHYLEFAVRTIVASNLLIKVLHLETEVHKRFIRKFIHRQLENVKIYCHELHYVEQTFKTKQSTYYTESYGTALYSFSSVINHSCSPNILRVYHGSTVTIVVLKPIQKGEQLFDCYCNIYWETEKIERQKRLRSQFGFHCKCEACENDYPLRKDLKMNPMLPSLPRSFRLPQDPKDVIEAIKENFEFLSVYSTKANNRCSQIVNVELTLKRYLSHYKRCFA